MAINTAASVRLSLAPSLPPVSASRPPFRAPEHPPRSSRVPTWCCAAVATTCGVAADNLCLCENGTVATGANCTTHGAKICQACDPGYEFKPGAVACTETQCNAFSFGAGVRGDAAHADPCTPGVALSTHTNPSCGLACSEHFVGCRRRGTCIAVVSRASSEKCGTVLLDECSSACRTNQ